MRTVELSAEEVAYLLRVLARQRFALERYGELKRREEGVEQELALLRGIVARLSAAGVSPEPEAG